MITKTDLQKMIRVVADINHDMTPRTAFFMFSGHIEGASIQVYPAGWKTSHSVYTSFDIVNNADLQYMHKTVENGEILKEPVEYMTLDDVLKAVKEVRI